MNRIEPVGHGSDDIQAIAPVGRRAPDREREREHDEELPRDRSAAAASLETPLDAPPVHTFDEHGEHVDVRA